MRRVVALAAVLTLLCMTAFAPVPAAAANATAGNVSATPTATTTETPTAATPTATPSDGFESTVSVRIIPVHYDADYLSARQTTEGIETTGPFATFELGRAADQVEIVEPGARANLLADGRLVKVEYSQGASPGEQSLYHLRLYYPDGQQEVSLYASQTNVSVTGGELTGYRPFVEDMLDSAEEEGFERNPEGAQNYLDYLQERSQLFQNFFSEKFVQAMLLIWTWIRNPVGLGFTIMAAALAATWLYRNHGRVLDIISSDPGKSQRRRERIELDRQEAIATAADEHLSELSEIGTMGEVYWDDAYTVATVYELAELFRQGIPVKDKDEGEIYHIGGVDDLSPSNIHGSWLEPVVRDGRLASVEIALSHGAAALHRMMSKYGMALEYRETYEQVRDLQEQLDENAGYGRRHDFDVSGSPSGGD
ncbi:MULTISPECIES: hypothetical protein [Salinibaculum]|uniref:hypothetical protein n=1 Tax=Salinibaculum TaxID=2732368 RepID=UPI0030CCE454